jgi:SAM-dependent methyltransferase
VVCLNDVLDRVADPGLVVEEVYRVLKPGGKVMAVVPARFNIEFWRRVLLPWGIWYSRPAPGVSFTGRSLRALFHRFSEHRVHKRHLRRADVPHLWRLLPTTMLERMIGRLLVVKAFKPLSSAMQVPLAA